MRSDHPYLGARFGLASQHHKGRLFAPAFEDRLKANVVEICIDTDQFGTFSGDIPRTLSPEGAAIAKAQAGLEVSGLRFGLASEGTFGPDPLIPFVTSNIEIAVLVDLERNIVVVERARDIAPVHARTVVRPQEISTDFLARADFPRHALIVRAEDEHISTLRKGISDATVLEQAIKEASSVSPSGRAIVENDLRAHCSPTRQVVIIEAAARLAIRLASTCPSCGCPGWGVIDRERELPCETCGSTDTNSVSADVLGCPLCSHRQAQARRERFADKGTCNVCNP